jgi:hypothetical protein
MIAQLYALLIVSQAAGYTSGLTPRQLVQFDGGVGSHTRAHSVYVHSRQNVTTTRTSAEKKPFLNSLQSHNIAHIAFELECFHIFRASQ